MKQAVSSYKSIASRKRLLGSLVTVAVAVGVMLASAGAAAASGSGVFTGVESSPDIAVVPPIPPAVGQPLCGKATPTPAIPQVELLHMRGTLSYNGSSHGDATTPWTGTFKNSSNVYWVSPMGTFANQTNCQTLGTTGGYHVPSSAGGITISDGTNRCTGTGYYERHDTSLITIQMTNGNCGTVTNPVIVTNPSTVTWTGTQEPCPSPPDPFGVGLPETGCPDPAGLPGDPTLYQGLLDGTYTQTP